MSNNNKNEEIRQAIEDIKGSIATLSERQNSQYTEVMMALKEFKNQSTNDISEEDLYEDAKDLVVSHKTASASFIQRALYIGYARAAHILDKLEADGVIGPNDGSMPRKVLIQEKDQ